MAKKKNNKMQASGAKDEVIDLGLLPEVEVTGEKPDNLKYGSPGMLIPTGKVISDLASKPIGSPPPPQREKDYLDIKTDITNNPNLLKKREKQNILGKYKKHVENSPDQDNNAFGFSEKNFASIIDELVNLKYEYMNALDAQDKLTPTQFNSLTGKWDRNKIYDANVRNINTISSAFNKILNSADAYKKKKLEFDGSLPTISNGNDNEDLKKLTTLYGGRADVKVKNGQLVFNIKGKELSLSDFPEWFPKSKQFGESILRIFKQWRDVVDITPVQIRAIKEDIRNILRLGEFKDDVLLSAIQDGHGILSGGLGISKETHAELFKPENHEQLVEKAINDWTNVIVNTTKKTNNEKKSNLFSGMKGAKAPK